MPKMTNKQIDQSLNDDPKPQSERTFISPFRANRQSDNSDTSKYQELYDMERANLGRDLTSEEKQKIRSKSRRDKRTKERIANGETIRTRGAKLTDGQRLTAKRARRENRMLVRDLAIAYYQKHENKKSWADAYDDLMDQAQSGVNHLND